MSITLDELVTKYKSHEVDFVFPVEGKDTPAYLDLFLLYHSPEERWHQVQSIIHQYFTHYHSEYKANKITPKSLVNALKFPEVPDIALGYCEKGNKGHGGAEERAHTIKQVIFDDPNVQDVGIKALAKMSIIIKKTGPDLLSDLVANFAIQRLIDYTHEQAKIYDLKLNEYSIERALDLESMEWRPLLKVALPFFQETGEPRILVPRHIVRTLPVFSTMGFFKNYLRYVLKQEKEDQMRSTYATIGKEPKVSFDQIEADIKKSYDSVSLGVKAIAKDVRPDLLDEYISNPLKFKGKKKVRKKKENINWDSYIEQLTAMPAGKEYARNYADLIRKMMTAMYGEQLINGVMEEKSQDELFHYDVNFANAAETTFFKMLANQKIKAGVLIIEAKNYGATLVANKEFNQSRAYTIVEGRELVFLCKRDPVTSKDIDRARRHFLAQRCILLPVSDQDFIEMLENRKKDKDTFDTVLVPRLQKIIMT